ncbi:MULTISPECIES: tetratricopeptide repeat protein [Nitrosomonas]|uniref:Tfp pilus assembly protein PilF n=1 Tax=Nitrosomonas communis TaxID=44574 RepID=A0A5D3Y8V5_9PROT|nr:MULTISPECIES: tetratricopeptide repeat protein [Nitrosomonas]TYP80667.1 Tfp pilus assembly protein PilF [Nitrosomonas communis]UVS60203.1 tetratricopeptide repeat protein [Nitrosomonas sp. PLL12]
MTQIRIFLSTVSAEFRSYRDALRHDLERPNVTVKVQEDFIATGTETLDKLDEYLQQCDAVIHLVGDMTGALAQAPSLAFILKQCPKLAERLPPLHPFLEPGAQALSYTQWEAWLALYYRKRLIIAIPEAGAPRDAQYQPNEEQRKQQQQHLARLAALEHYPEIRFANPDRLAVEILRSKLHDILARAGALKKPVILPIASIGGLFKGRGAWLDYLSRSLGPVLENDETPVVTRVLSGLGGIGKTRLALEYAWRRGEDYMALLFVDANSVEALQRNLAALCHTFKLEEQRETDESRQRDAVLSWLRQNPGWLMILDNVDTEEVAKAVEDLVPQLFGGHLLVTSRLVNWSGSKSVLPVDLLSIEAAIEFLLERTDGKRRRLTDDNAQASILAETLGCLALALEQAGAYIFQNRLTLKGYLEKWHSQSDSVLSWYDSRLMQYPKSVAVTWQTTFDQLGESARQLLQRLAWLSPAPIPESLLDVRVVEGESESDPLTALAELESYSLVTRATDSPSFSVHRLVQEITRRQCDDSEHIRLTETLRWLDAAFVGDPQDVRNWPVLNPLLPHAQSVVEHADAAGIALPAARLMNQLGLMYLTKSLHAEAEPLMRRALAIDEASFGADHPKVALDLNDLAGLLLETNRLAEAEPLMRRALDIDEASLGVDHPEVARKLNNLAGLLQSTNRLTEAEPLVRRALAIDEASFGADHPNVARDLANLACLLKATNRLAEAESLMRRTLAIDEASFGSDHPNVAIHLNNLAQLLQDTNHLAEAEPLMRRALAIDEASFGADHPKVAIRLNNLAGLLKDTNRLAEAEPLIRRALAIFIESVGTEYPHFRIVMENYISLLVKLGRTESEIKASLGGLFGKG